MMRPASAFATARVAPRIGRPIRADAVAVRHKALDLRSAANPKRQARRHITVLAERKIAGS